MGTTSQSDGGEQWREATEASGVRTPLTPAESEFARELFELHRPSLYRYLVGLLPSQDDAREVLQETYLRLLRQRSFEHIRANARAYLFQIATNLARDLFRQRTHRADIAREGALRDPDTTDWATWPDLELTGEQLVQIIVAALEELPGPMREAVLLYRFRDMTHHEIAARLQLSTRTIERYIRDGLAHIARRLQEVS
jgi:RNA polymerase sigma-70 factor (ECF subfamily)